MKQTFLNHVKPLRYLAMLLIIVLSGATANAALESDDINDAILVDGSLAVKWVNDPTNPWILSPDGSFVRIPVVEGEHTSTLSMLYTSQYPIDLNLDWYFMGTGDYSFIIRIDGIEKAVDPTYGWRAYHGMLPPGNHTIDFIATTNAYTDDDYYYAGIRNLKAIEYKELETACLKPGSMELTFQNDPQHMWLTQDGYITSMTSNLEDATSRISTTFSIDKPSVFSFDYKHSTYASYVNTKVYIDGTLYKTLNNYDNWSNESFVLYPGEHTVVFEHYNGPAEENWTQLRNVCLDQTWYDVTVTQPGTLSNRIINALQGKNLQDAELVSITGSLNDTDWATIKQLIGIKAIDFTQTDITEIPDEAFRGLSYLSTVMLPETLKEIGYYAFYGTNFHSVTIPASVETIKYRAWDRTPLQFIDFAPNSKLTTIGHCVFSYTNLIEFIMPDSVTTARRSADEYNYSDWSENFYDNWDTFSYCKNLKKLHLSEGLTTVPRGCAYECDSLEEVNIPKNATEIEWEAFAYTPNLKNVELPGMLNKIAYRAFAYSALESIAIPKNVSIFSNLWGECRAFEHCTNLKTAFLNSHYWNMGYDFNNCTALETVVLPCATPPSVYSNYDPFYEVNKANITLIVPDFALDAYKTDSYWFQFTNIQAGDEASLNDYWAIRGELTLNSTHAMQGTPSIEIMTGGILNMDADAQQVFDEFTYNTQESNPASYLSESNNVKANKLTMTFNVEEPDKWYFFSPVCDVKMSDVTYPATDSWVIRYYDGARRATEQDNSGNWINVPADGTLHRGQGYIIQANTAGVLNLPVATTEYDNFFGANEVTMALEDNPSEAAAHAGWNLVANPYPTYFDIYYLDMEAPLTVWDGETYRAYALNDGDYGDDNYVLRPMQPFFVQKASADITAHMPLTGRRTSTAIDRTRAPRRTSLTNAANRDFLNLQLLTGNKEKADDYTRIVINEEASINYDMRCDASKFMSLNNAVAQLYSIGTDNVAMAINERPYDNGNVALGVYLPVKGANYRIAATRADRQAWIYDAETGIEHDLTSGDYNFTASKTGKDDTRFSIRFAPGTTSVKGVTEGGVKVVGNNASISVIAPANALVTVYSTDGSVIATATVDSTVLDIPVANGIYMVKVNGETFKTIVK